MHSFRTVLRPGAVLFMTIVLAACSAGTDDNTGGGTIAVVDGVAEISADELEFNASTITAPAGEPFTVSLSNADTVPHNFSVYVSEGGELIAEGEIINQGQTDDVEIEGLSAGEYFFVCDLHPDMNGTIIVGA